MEMQSRPTQEAFKRSEKFEINNSPFRDIEVSRDRIVARGKTWTTFELLVSYIGAAWLQKARRYGGKMLAVGIVLIPSPFWMIFLLGYMGFYIGFVGTAAGTAIVVLWAVLKRESVIMFTPSKPFRFEGNAEFIDALWQAVTALQRLA